MNKKHQQFNKKSLLLFSIRGFGLTETIITITIMSILMLATNRTMIQSIKATKLIQSTSSENDLGSTLGDTLYNEDLCKSAFKPGAFGINSQGVGVLDLSILPKIEEVDTPGGNTEDVFKNQLQIIKIELTADSPAGNPSQELVKRLFTIYYKLRRVDEKVDTKDNQDCTTLNTSGCYTHSCNVSYQLNTSGTDVITCDILDCAGTQHPLALVLPCFTAETTDDERLLVGCGTTQPSYYDPTIYTNASHSNPVIEANNTAGNATQITGLGYNTGEVVPFWISEIGSKTTITGTGHVFLGMQPARDAVVEGSYHTFIGGDTIMGGTVKGTGNAFFGLGTGGGSSNIEGRYNSFFGYNSGMSATISGSSARHNTSVGTYAGTAVNITGTGEGNTFLDSNYDTDNPIHFDIGINNGDYNTFLGSHSGRKTSISGDKNTFIGYGSGFDLTINDDNNINIANALIAKPANTPTLNSTAHTINDKEVKIAGVLLLCDKGGGDCIEASPIDHTHAQLHLPDITDEYGAVGADGKEGDFHICTDNSPNLPIECEKVSLEGHDDLHNPLRVSGALFQINGTEVAYENDGDHGTNTSSEVHNPGGQTYNYALENHQSKTTHNHLRYPHSHSGYASVGHTHPSACSAPACSCTCPSSKVYKKDIIPFTKYDEALRDIIKTPLFTFQYKDKDMHPNKQRMGIISEELPMHLQFFKDKEQTDSDPKEQISHPDWPSIYGTFWAAIKSLFTKFKTLEELITSEMEQLHTQKQTLLSSLFDSRKEFQDIQQRFTKRREEIAQIKTNLTNIQKEIDETHREIQELKKSKERLETDRSGTDK